MILNETLEKRLTLLFSLSFDLMIIKIVISFTHFIGTMKGKALQFVNINLLKIPKIFIERLE